MLLGYAGSRVEYDKATELELVKEAQERGLQEVWKKKYERTY